MNQESETRKEPPWREHLREMAWVKWGMVWIAVFCVMVPVMIFAVFTGAIHEDAVAFVILVHIIGMSCCFECPEAIVKWRMWFIGVSVLMFANVILGLTIAPMGRTNPLPAYHYTLGQPFTLLLFGLWPWLFFLRKLAIGIHARKCAWLAWAILVSHSIMLLGMFLTTFRWMGMIDFWNAWDTFHLNSLFVAYPVLIISLWWRIRGMLRDEREKKRYRYE